MDDDFLTQALSNLPKTSNAFTRLKNVSLSVVDVDPTASPPRKWARTGQDRDISRHKGEGQDLHGDVKIALQNCVDVEFRKLMTMPLGDMKWLAQLVQVWQWYESRLVRSLSSSRRHMRDGSSCGVLRVF